MRKLSAFRALQQWVFQLNHSKWVDAVATTSNGRCPLTGSHDGTLKLWDLRTGELIRSLVGHTDAVSAVAVSPDDHLALSGSADHTLRLWDLTTGQLLHSFTEHVGPVVAVAMSPDGRHSLSGSRDRTLRLWDLNERVCRAVAPLESAPLAIALASDSRTAVVGDRMGSVHNFHIVLD